MNALVLLNLWLKIIYFELRTALSNENNENLEKTAFGADKDFEVIHFLNNQIFTVGLK